MTLHRKRGMYLPMDLGDRKKLEEKERNEK
jgi:hypothetical protein